jgi:hypothetical protein
MRPQTAPEPSKRIRTSGYYVPGDYTVADLYVSPTGDDTNTGTSSSAPLRTITAAWNKIPTTMTATGYRINLLPGTFPCEPLPEDINNCINYFSDRLSTAQFPIILRALGGTATVRGGLNFNHVSYLYLYDLTLVGGTPLPTNSSGNNLLHLEQGDHVLLHGLTLRGPACDSDGCNNLQEVLKVNQTQYLYVEDSAISGAWHSVVDYFVVQYGHFLNNQVQIAGQWCMYIKGGSSYLNIEGNEFSRCLLGFQAGQAANLAVMRSPWFHYETYDVKFVNNVLHDIPGVGFSAAGAYNALFAYNTLYRVGTSTGNGYGLAQSVHGERNCTPIEEIPNVTQNCPIFTAQGAWGPTVETDSREAIPDRNVYVYNNLFYNPPLAQTLYYHLGVNGPIARPANFANSPDPASTDDHLIFRGNVIWNAPSAGLPTFGSTGGGPVGCQSGSTCAEAQVIAENTFNQVEPQLVDPLHGDFRPLAGGNLFAVTTFSIPSFTWDTFTPAVPSGNLSNAVNSDRAGNVRSGTSPPGAYAVGATPGIARLFLPLILR